MEWGAFHGFGEQWWNIGNRVSYLSSKLVHRWSFLRRSFAHNWRLSMSQTDFSESWKLSSLLHGAGIFLERTCEWKIISWTQHHIMERATILWYVRSKLAFEAFTHFRTCAIELPFQYVSLNTLLWSEADEHLQRWYHSILWSCPFR